MPNADLDLDAGSQAFTIRKNGKLYTSAPQVTAEDTLWFSRSSDVAVEERITRMSEMISSSLIAHHGDMTPEKVRKTLTFPEMSAVIGSFFALAGRPAFSIPPSRPKTVAKKKTGSSQKTPALT